MASSLIDASLESDFHGFEKSQEYLCCDSCDYKASSRSLMLYHFESSHSVSTVYSSPTAESRLKSNYKRKVGATEKLKSVLLCALCGHQSKGSYRMKRHQQLHYKESAFTCSICKFSVSNRNRLSCHMNRVHPTERVQFIAAQRLNSKQPKALPKQRPKSKLHECELCDFSTWDSYHMKQHNICHQRNRKIKCPLCSFSSDSKYGVSVHLNRHHRSQSTLDGNRNGSSQENPEEGEIEPESALLSKERPLVTQSNERAHADDSSGNHAHNEGPEESPNVSSTNLKRKKEILQCGQCDFATFTQRDMKSHNANHETIGRFKCPLCTYSNDRKCVVSRHYGSFHLMKSKTDDGFLSQSDQEPSVSENKGVNPLVISAKVSSKVTVKAAIKKKKLRPENKKRTAVSLLRSINPTGLPKRQCLPLIRSFQETKKSQLNSNRKHCGWLVTNHLISGSSPNSPEKSCRETLEIGESNIGIEKTTCDFHGLSVSHEVESGPHPTSSAIKSALTEYDGLQESSSTLGSGETIQTNSQTSGNETMGDVGLTQQPIILEASQPSYPERRLAYSPIPRCEIIKEEPCSLTLETPLELEDDQEKVDLDETFFISTTEGPNLPEEIADVNPLELTNRYTLESEETACRTQLIRYKMAAKSGRLSIRELYSEVKKQRQHHVDKGRELHQLRINLQAQEETTLLADITLKETSSKLDQTRTRLHEISSRKVTSDYKLKTLESEATLLRIAILKPQRTDKELNDLASLENEIKTVKDENKQLKKDLRALSKEEAKMTDGLKQALNESKSAYQLLSTLSDNLKVIQMNQKEYAEDKLNNLIISTEESFRCYFKLKNWLLEILFLKKNKESNVNLYSSLESLRKSIDFNFL